MSSARVNLESYRIPLAEINRATDNFSQQRCIGDGGFGAVYKGLWQNRSVAIKRLSKDSHQGEREFRNELEMISRFHHENIISFVGYCDEEKEKIIVYEYAANESLDHHLHDSNKMRCITWVQRLKICIGAARGLNYLHSGLGEHNRVIHRDVKSANILLDDIFVAKVCDFGLSKLGPRNEPNTELNTKVAGTHNYIDPAYLESGILRKESDVYSLGVVLFELLSGMLVYSTRSTNDDQQSLMNSVRRYHQKEPHKLIDPDIRNQIDNRSFNTFIKIASQCISLTLMERPTLDTVIKKIEEALTIQTSTPEAHSKIESLLRKLKSGRPSYQRTAAREICLLCRINAENCTNFAQAGVIPHLKDLLTAPDSQTQEHAVTALRNLSLYEENNDSIVSSGAVLGIIQVLRKGSMEARENAADTLLNLCKIYKNKVIIGGAEAIPHLVSLLSKGTQTGKKTAVTTLFNLCLYQGNKGRAVSAGVIPILMEFLKEPQDALKDEALAILDILSTHHEGRLAIGRAEAIPILVEVIGSGSPNNKENAAAVLVELCYKAEYLAEIQQHEFMGKGKSRSVDRNFRRPPR